MKPSRISGFMANVQQWQMMHSFFPVSPHEERRVPFIDWQGKVRVEEWHPRAFKDGVIFRVKKSKQVL